MAATLLRAPSAFTSSNSSLKSHQININNKFICVSTSFSHTHTRISLSKRCRIYHSPKPIYLSSSTTKHSDRFRRFIPFASDSEATSTETTVQSNISDDEQAQQSQEPEEKEKLDEDVSESEEEPSSAIIVSLQSYKEALENNDESKVNELEDFFKSIGDEKISLEQKVESISEQLSYEKARVLRISADFENFRKRTERERLSLVTNAQGEVVETLLPVLDNFERAKSQIKVQTEEEEKISNSYQGIYKQFVEILGSLGVIPVETIGKPFDPMLHEAIMREESTEFEQGVVIEEYRKGFQLGDRLLRPSMVKVSAGPGPEKPPPHLEEQIEEEDATPIAESQSESQSDTAHN